MALPKQQDLYVCGTHALAFYLSPKAKRCDRKFEDALARRNPHGQPANFLAFKDGVVELGGRSGMPLDGYRPRLSKQRGLELRRFFGESLPLNVAVPAEGDRRFSTLLSCWIHPGSVPQESYIHVAQSLYIAIPELAVLQACGMYGVLEIAVLMSMLCALYVSNPRVKGGLEPRRRVCSPESLAEFPASFLLDNSAPMGIGIYQRALGNCIEQAASPAELELALMLTLPKRMGGYGLPMPRLNERLEGPLGARGALYPDLLWRKQGVAVEYQSDANHLDASQASQDRMRKNQLLDAGIKLFEVSSRQLRSPLELEGIAVMLSKALGCRAPENTRAARDARAATQESIECALDHFGSLWL